MSNQPLKTKKRVANKVYCCRDRPRNLGYRPDWNCKSYKQFRNHLQSSTEISIVLAFRITHNYCTLSSSSHFPYTAEVIQLTTFSHHIKRKLWIFSSHPFTSCENMYMNPLTDQFILQCSKDYRFSDISDLSHNFPNYCQLIFLVLKLGKFSAALEHILKHLMVQ